MLRCCANTVVCLTQSRDPAWSVIYMYNQCEFFPCFHWLTRYCHHTMHPKGYWNIFKYKAMMISDFFFQANPYTGPLINIGKITSCDIFIDVLAKSWTNQWCANFSTFWHTLKENETAIRCIQTAEEKKIRLKRYISNKPDLINMAVLFWYLVLVPMVHWTRHILQGTRTTRPCIIGHTV